MNFFGPCLKEFLAWMWNWGIGTTLRFGNSLYFTDYAVRALTFFRGQADNIGEKAKAQHVKQALGFVWCLEF